MYVYRGSAYIKRPFILQCCRLLCSLSPRASAVGVFPWSCSVCRDGFHRRVWQSASIPPVPLGLSPLSWRWALLLRPCFREQNETQQPQGGQGNRFGLRGLVGGAGLNVVDTLISGGEQNTALVFPLYWFSARCTLPSGSLSSRSEVQTRAVGFGLQHHVRVCIYAHMYIFIQQVCTSYLLLFFLWW